MKLSEHIEWEKRKAAEEAANVERRKGATKLLAKGCSIEEIADFYEISVDEAKELLNN